MPRAARKKSESGIYHVMLRGINQQQIFEDQEDFEKFLSVLKDCKALSGFRLYAYCLMGNHIHLLIKEEKERLDLIFRRIGSRYVYWYNAKYGREGHLFQDRYKSEPVEDEEYLLTVLRYIHQNPVKVGLCNSVDDYRFSSYSEYISTQNIIDACEILSIISLDSFIEINHKPVDSNCLEISEKSVIKVTDEQARAMIKEVSDCENATSFQALDTDLRNAYISLLKNRGLSIRQLCRLTGISFGVIQKL